MPDKQFNLLKSVTYLSWFNYLYVLTQDDRENNRQRAFTM